jgi:hypothetical protein
MRESDALNLGQCGRLMVCVATLDSLGKSSDSDHRSFYAAFAEQSRMSTAETQLPICCWPHQLQRENDLYKETSKIGNDHGGK